MITTLFLLFTLTSSAEKIFSCYKPINPYDPTFSQGQEMFMDILVEDSEQTVISLSRMAGREVQFKKSSPLRISDDFSTISLRIEGGYLSMVYLGGTSWGAFLKQTSEADFPIENEFMCRELLDITKL